MSEPQKWYSATQVAKIWGAVTATVLSRIEDGSLGAINIGKPDAERRTWRISDEHLADFEAARANPKPPAKESKSSRRTIARPTKDYFAASQAGAK